MNRKVTKQGNPILRALLLNACIAVLGVLALSITACDLMNPDKSGTADVDKATYTGTNDDDVYTLTITEKTSSKVATYTPKPDDSYTLKIGTSLSSGTVSLAETTGNTLKFTLIPTAAGATAFTVTVLPSENKIANVAGTITFDTGTTKTGPGDLKNNGTTSLTGTVTITGTTKVGQTLTVNTSSLGGSGTISYQWNRVKDSTSTAITGANSSTYPLIAFDIGSKITATVTRTGYSGSVTSEATTSVVEDPTLPELGGYLYLNGYAQVGQTLEANIRYIYGGAGTYFYQWKRVSGSTSTNIGTNSQTYDVVDADIGSTITVAVTRSGNKNYITSTNQSEVVVAAGTLTGYLELDYNCLQVGYTVVLYDDLIGTGTLKFQWKRTKNGNDTNIGSTTSNSMYLLTDEDIGSKIKVTVTRDGLSGSVTSNSIGPITANDFSYTAGPNGIIINGFREANGNNEYIEIPYVLDGISVTSIAANAFKNKNLKEVYIADNVVSIGEYAFDGNELNYVRIGSNVELGTSAFSAGFINAYNTQNNKASGQYYRPDTTTGVDVWQRSYYY